MFSNPPRRRDHNNLHQHTTGYALAGYYGCSHAVPRPFDNSQHGTNTSHCMTIHPAGWRSASWVSAMSKICPSVMLHSICLSSMAQYFCTSMKSGLVQFRTDSATTFFMKIEQQHTPTLSLLAFEQIATTFNWLCRAKHPSVAFAQ
jgi:hypothetical protein